MFANDYQRLQLFFAWLLSPYYPNSQLFTRFQFRKLLTINEKRKPSSDFLFDLKAEDEDYFSAVSSLRYIAASQRFNASITLSSLICVLFLYYIFIILIHQ